MNDAPAALLDLQQVDRVRDRLYEQREHLPLRAELAGIEARIGEVRGAVARVLKEIDELERDEKRVEEEVRLIEEKIASEEDKMYSGKVINPKEVSAIQSEVEMLKRRKEPLEEKGLGELEQRDQLMRERSELDAEIADLEREAGEVREKIAEAEGSIDRDLATEGSKRTELVGSIPPETLDDYETIREAKKGIGVGALVDGMCTACRETLSAVEIDRIKAKARNGEWLFRCEHCRRLLVVR